MQQFRLAAQQVHRGRQRQKTIQHLPRRPHGRLGRYPVRTDVAAPEGLPALEDVDLVDYDRDQATAMRESVLEKFEAEIMANRT